jgi:predicted RNA binding protein YcfA (HicA-like mRNA interferase family)
MLTSREVIARLEQAGWRKIRQRGSHVQMKKDGVAAIVTVPHPKKDLKRGTLRSIERASGVQLIKD